MKKLTLLLAMCSLSFALIVESPKVRIFTPTSINVGTTAVKVATANVARMVITLTNTDSSARIDVFRASATTNVIFDGGGNPLYANGGSMTDTTMDINYRGAYYAISNEATANLSISAGQ